MRKFMAGVFTGSIIGIFLGSGATVVVAMRDEDFRIALKDLINVKVSKFLQDEAVRKRDQHRSERLSRSGYTSYDRMWSRRTNIHSDEQE